MLEKMSKSKGLLVQKNDWNRALLSETTPAEIPILVSNDGGLPNAIEDQKILDPFQLQDLER